MRNDNVNTLLGMIHEPPHIFFVNDFCPRGALKDILENDEFKMDAVFLTSITHDLVKGLSYLHDSDIGFHGRLKSSNCIVDARWSVRLSSYGMHYVREGEEKVDTDDSVQVGKEDLWTAPEILRMSGYLVAVAHCFSRHALLHPVDVPQGRRVRVRHRSARSVRPPGHVG